MKDITYFDIEKCELDQEYLKYCDLLLYHVGFFPSQEYVQTAKKYIFEKYPEYRKFINPDMKYTVII